MDLKYVQERYAYYSGKASDITRQFGFAGIAIIWIFRSETDKQWKVPRELLPAAILITIGLGLDFLQYIAGTLMWAVYRRLKERAGTPATADFLAPNWINWPALTFFWLKIIFVASAYAVLIKFLADRFLTPS
jgi:hypothetical protein